MPSQELQPKGFQVPLQSRSCGLLQRQHYPTLILVEVRLLKVRECTAPSEKWYPKGTDIPFGAMLDIITHREGKNEDSGYKITLMAGHTPKMEESDTYNILTPGVDRRGMFVRAQQLG